MCLVSALYITEFSILLSAIPLADIGILPPYEVQSYRHDFKSHLLPLFSQIHQIIYKLFSGKNKSNFQITDNQYNNKFNATNITNKRLNKDLQKKNSDNSTKKGNITLIFSLKLYSLENYNCELQYMLYSTSLDN
ncbi:hypothetical protein H8356DRAFT_1352437 [Neocallimastix lanati (nom. inval.)]|nr:hypothetical protein H8356DRAFT_1352437 [Neocallimastix sp. JGI-2020a]